MHQTSTLKHILLLGAAAFSLLATDTTAIADDGALTGHRHRVLVSSDIGGTDPDDFQSMVHLLTYADSFDIEGLVASPYGLGRREQILKVIDAYAIDYPNLKSHSDKYPTPDALRAICKQGAPDLPDHSGIGEATDGSNWIIECARREDPRPLHVLVWGGIDDIGQALHDAPDILPKLRVYWIGGPNKKWGVNAYNYIEKNHPKLWMIESNATYRGWFVGGNQEGKWNNREFVSTHIAEHGALGKLFVDAKDTIKMGDTPSLARLMRGTSEDPTQPGWGGKYVRIWDGRKAIFDRLTTRDDEVEVFGVTEFALPMPDGYTSNHTATMIFNGGRPPSPGVNEGNVLRFRFSPRDAKVWSYVIKSDLPELDGKSGAVNAVPPSIERTSKPSATHPNWWIDDPDPAAAEGVHPGAKSVNQWREDYLRDFAGRMNRCKAPAKAEASTRPHARVGALPLSEVRWTDGFWKQRFENCRTKMIPTMWELMKGTEYKPFYEHFRIAAGLSEGRYRGAKWNDGDFYKWMEGVTSTLAVEPSEEWEQRLDEIIEVIGKAQREDGYIHTPVLIGARNGDPNARPFSDRFAFEVYNMGHLITAACVHHRVTGKDNFLALAKKTAAFLDTAFSHPTAEQARHAVCPSHYMGLVDLYRITGDPKHLELAKRFLEMRALVTDGGDDNQDRIPFVEQTEAVGHAVRANYLYAGAADVFAETGDPALLSPLTRIWDNMVQKKMHITGGCGALYDGASPDGSNDQASITRIHQAYGRNYQLPNITAHNETCANIGNVLWNWRMFLVTGEAKYMDVAELALYNSVLSGVGLNGKDYFYVNALRQTDPLPAELRWKRLRVPFVTSFCCPPNVVRTVAQVNGYAYAKSDDTLWVNLYGGNTLTTTLADDNKVTLTQESNYPWEGKIRITVPQCGSKPFTLQLRIPGWTTEASILLNGSALQTPCAPGSYTAIRREWKPGDTVELNLSMEPQLIESHPLVEETRNELAIKRGPIVYCLESNDLPEGVRLSNISIPTDIQLEPRYTTDLLDGVTVLEGNVIVRTETDDTWDGKLYRTFKQREAHPVAARFIPYYSWANRGRSEMSVWLPAGNH
ncbi:MAG: glycoside hydrolase family 127 protein [Verrucomicrobiae bacterium]|nr:glycoside hydrolase family 127 protein [Verrucomicrobiae bacterium]